MKKMNKKGFTLVEIMIVVAIIGLLAAIGIPSILNAYSTSQENAKARNVAEVEKAKGVLTLPASSLLPGAMGLTDTTLALNTGAAGSNLMAALRITSASELTVGGTTIAIGTLATKAAY
jgi:prepilin-type N-terminal cleavage/methylation domain-containing protein